MARPISLFISYCHEDERHRERLGRFLRPLERQGLVRAWHDRMIKAGSSWRDNIMSELTAADVILLLVSVDFLASDFCYETEMACALGRHLIGECRVIAVILSDCDWESSPLVSTQVLPTDAKPVVHHRPQDRAWFLVATAIRDLADQLRDDNGLSQDGEEPDTPPPIGPGLHSKASRSDHQVYLESGTVPLDSLYYVQRATDHDAWNQLNSTQPTVIIKGHRQSGKSSLLVRLRAQEAGQAHPSCYISYQQLDVKSLQDSETFFRQLAWMLADQFKTDVDPDEEWSERRSLKHNVSRFLERAVLSRAAKPVSIVFDEVDIVLESERIRTDFFSMIRGWHNRRADDLEGHWRKLRVVIAHSTEPSLWIADLNQSPFNVGRSFTLPDFDMGQIDELNVRYGEPLESGEVRGLGKVIGGHPYLVRLALFTLVTNNWRLRELEEAAVSPKSPFIANMERHWQDASDWELSESVRQVISQGRCDDEAAFRRLWAAGVVSGEHAGAVTMRCELYRHFFESRLR